MTDQTAEAPIMVRADITRDDLTALKMLALSENKTTQALLGELIREKTGRTHTKEEA